MISFFFIQKTFASNEIERKIASSVWTGLLFSLIRAFKIRKDISAIVFMFCFNNEQKKNDLETWRLIRKKRRHGLKIPWNCKPASVIFLLRKILFSLGNDLKIDWRHWFLVRLQNAAFFALNYRNESKLFVIVVKRKLQDHCPILYKHSARKNIWDCIISLSIFVSIAQRIF